MTTLNGIKDDEYLAQFLGKKIAVQDEENPNKYYIYPELVVIYSSGFATAIDSKGRLITQEWDRFENPYILEDKEIVLK